MVEESMARAGIEEMELDESNPPRDDFLWWSYHVSGENPAAWQVSAKDLLDGAMAVKAKVQPFDNAMHSLARVEAMLLGMALECLLKGMYIRRHRVWADPAKCQGRREIRPLRRSKTRPVGGVVAVFVGRLERSLRAPFRATQA